MDRSKYEILDEFEEGIAINKPKNNEVKITFFGMAGCTSNYIIFPYDKLLKFLGAKKKVKNG